MFCTLERSGAKPSIGQLSIVWLGWKVIDEIRLWTDHAQGRCRADPCGSRLADGRAAAPLLAAGVRCPTNSRDLARNGAHSRRGDRRVPRQGGPGRLPRSALRASRHLARMGPYRGERHPLLLPRLALRYRWPCHRNAVRDGGVPRARWMCGSRPIRSRNIGGLVFVYMGPPGTEPRSRSSTSIDPDRGDDVVLRGHAAVGRLRGRLWSRTATGCSTTRISSTPGTCSCCTRRSAASSSRGALMQGVPRIALGEDAARRALQRRSRICRTATAWCATPNASCRTFSSSRASASPARSPSARNAAPNCRGPCRSTTSTCAASASSPGRSRTASRSPTGSPGTDTVADIRPAHSSIGRYEERQRKPDDLEAQEGQRPIAVHALENLAHSDSGIVMLRQDAARAACSGVEQGRRPDQHRARSRATAGHRNRRLEHDPVARGGGAASGRGRLTTAGYRNPDAGSARRNQSDGEFRQGAQ